MTRERQTPPMTNEFRILFTILATAIVALVFVKGCTEATL